LLREGGSMVAAYLNRVVTAVPNNDMHQRFIDCVPLMIKDECSRALFRRMVSRAEIEHRYSIMKVSIVSALFPILENPWLFINVKHCHLHCARWINSILDF
jgi:hypothetical protein